MEQEHLRVKKTNIALLGTFCLATACSCSAKSAAPSLPPDIDDTDTAVIAALNDTEDPEDIATEGDIVGSGYW